jgi:predicted dehydrogenase
VSGKTVRIGLIGTGGIGKAHVRRLLQIPEARIVALCDIVEERVRAAAAPLHVPTYTDGARMIAEAPMDALYVCVPPDQHGDLEIRAARKGLHLFVEKPVSLYLDQALKVAEAVREAGVMSQSGYSFRYLASGLQLKRFLEDKPVGTASVVRWGGMPETPWWRRYAESGGQLVEMTTHQVDLLRWVMGEVERLGQLFLSSTPRRSGGRDRPDTQAALLHFRSGASATVSTSCALGKAFRGEAEFVVKDARVVWNADGIRVEPEGMYAVPSAPEEAPSIDAAFVRAVASGNPRFPAQPVRGRSALGRRHAGGEPVRRERRAVSPCGGDAGDPRIDEGTCLRLARRLTTAVAQDESGGKEFNKIVKRERGKQEWPSPRTGSTGWGWIWET